MIRFMTRSRRAWLIGLMAVVYSTLLVMAAGCALAHADLSQSHQHHHSGQGSSGLHSLCAWACQATADAVAAIGPPPTVTGILVGSIHLSPYQFIQLADYSTVSPRAPPSIPVV